MICSRFHGFLEEREVCGPASACSLQGHVTPVLKLCPCYGLEKLKCLYTPKYEGCKFNVFILVILYQ